MSNDSRFLEMRAEHGVDHQGNLEPLAEVGLSIPVPTLLPVVGEVTKSVGVRIRPADSLAAVPVDENGGRLPARIIPGTRIVETTSDLIAHSLIGCGQYLEVPKPTRAAVERARKDTEAHIEAMSARDKQVELGNEPAPDATDNTPAAAGEEE